MVPRSEFRKKSDSTPSEDAREKDWLIAELKDHIAVLENELRLKRECAPFSEAAERKRAEEALKLTQFALDNFRDSAIWLTMDGRIIYVNQAACMSLGYSREELLSMHMWDIDPDYTMKRLRELWKDAKQQGYTLKFESKHVARDGRVFTVEVTSSYTRYGDKEYLITFDRDITERKKAEAELIKKNDDLAALNGKLRQLSQAVQQSASVVVITDTTGSIQYVNPKFTELTGYSVEEAIGKNPRILKTGEMPPEEYKRLWETITSGKDWRGVFHNKKKNGDLYWESAIISPVMDDSGKITNFMAVKEDITERKLAEEALRASEEKYRELVENANSIILRFDVHGNLTFFNEYAEKLFGYSRNEALGRDVVGMIVPVSESTGRDLKAIMEDMKRHPERYRSNVNENVCKNGDRLWIAWTNKAICDEHGNVVEILSVGNDITGRKRMEDALRESEERFHAVADNIPVLAWMADADGRIFWFNKQCYDYTGMTLEELQGWGWEKVIHPDYVKSVTEVWQSMIKTRQPCDNIFPLRVKDGSYRWFLTRSRPILNEDGTITRWFGTQTDITDRKNAEEALQDKQEKLKVQAEELHVYNEELARQIEERWRAEEALRESEEKFRILADFTYDWVTWSSPAGNNVYVSPSCERITGHRAEEFYNDPGLRDRIVHSDDMKAFGQHMDSHLRNASICGNFDFRIISTSGETRWINHVCQPVFRDNGEWLGRRASNRDITERKLAEEALLVSEERLRRASSAGRIGLFERNEDRERVYFSPEAYELYGLEPGSPGTYETWLSTVHPDDLETVERRLAENRENACRKPGYTAQLEFRVVHYDGAVHWLEVQSTYALEGGELMVRGAVRDITERKRAEKELEDYRKRLEDLVQERTCKLDEEKRQVEMYVDLMSHDISNMNQVGLGFLELALDMLDLDEAGREMLLNPKSAFEKSSRLIDNVRKLQKARSGEYESKEMDIGQVLGKVQEHYTKQYGQGITLNYLMNVGYVVKANELLYDLFSNLVANAIKHSRGHPIIDIKVEQVSENGRDYYKIAIDDRGPGVPDRLKSIIFDRKLTGDACSKGSGIGLFLVKTLVDGYRGIVWVEDRIKGDCTKGARFVVMLPVCEVESGNAKR